MRLLDRLLWWKRPEAKMEQAVRDQAVLNLRVHAGQHVERVSKLAEAFKKMRQDLHDDA